MPASTTAKKPTDPNIKFNDSLEKARYRIMSEFENSSYQDIAELVCKLMIKYTREEMSR